MTAVREHAIDTLIERKPGVNGGRPCLAGTGFSVLQISVCYNEGLSPEEIVASYPQLDLMRVYAGITYYLLNREFIDADLEEEVRVFNQLSSQSKVASS